MIRFPFGSARAAASPGAVFQPAQAAMNNPVATTISSEVNAFLPAIAIGAAVTLLSGPTGTN